MFSLGLKAKLAMNINGVLSQIEAKLSKFENAF